MELLYILLAGGRGERLKPLTADRPKPLVRFGSEGRLIDYTLNNCLSSGGGDVMVLTQHYPEMMEEYLSNRWRGPFRKAGLGLDVTAAADSDKGQFYGTADAAFQALSSMERLPGRVVVLAADHVYEMDYLQMVDFHKSHDGVATIGAAGCLESEVSQFGVFGTAPGGWIRSFHEKPSCLADAGMQGENPIVSMGIYVFDTPALMDYLEFNQTEDANDFGHNILPRMVSHGRAWAYEFRGSDGSPGYWKDAGTLQSYWKAHMDVLNTQDFDGVPTGATRKGKDPFPRTDLIGNFKSNGRRIYKSVISEDAEIGDATINKCVIAPGAVVADGAIARNCVILDNAVIGENVRLSNKVVPYGVEVQEEMKLEDLRVPEMVTNLEFPKFH